MNHLLSKLSKSGFYGIFLVALALPIPGLVKNGFAQSSEHTLFRIGTGGTAGTYLPFGTIISESLSGSTGLLKSSPHFMPDLVAVAQRSLGSASNVEDISANLLEAGFAQADVAHFAYTGTGPYAGKPALNTLRGVASLYLESVHLVVRADSNINGIADLRGKRVSLDEFGSGTQVEMKVILSAFDIALTEMSIVYLKAPEAIYRLNDNQLDAFFMVAGFPVKAVTELVNEGKARVVPIDGDVVNTLLEEQRFLSIDSIPQGTYSNDNDIPTLGVPAQLIIDAKLNDEFVYKITSLLWNQKTLDRLKQGHPKGNDLSMNAALKGMSIPLHSGAARFYADKGLTLDE